MRPRKQPPPEPPAAVCPICGSELVIVYDKPLQLTTAAGVETYDALCPVCRHRGSKTEFRRKP